MSSNQISFAEFQKSFQKLIGHYTAIDFKEELAVAKKEFFDNTGSLDENKPHFNLRMFQFYEWYFLTRPLQSYMKTPLAVCDMHRDLRLTEDDRASIEILKTSQHSFFEYSKTKGDFIIIKDLFTGKKLEVYQTDLVFGFDQKEYFQARLIMLHGKYYFLKR